MKYFAAILGLLIWLLSTVVLSLSVVGWVAIMIEEWWDISNRLLGVFDYE